MEKIPDLVAAKAKVLRDMSEVISNIRQLSQKDVKDVQDGMMRLREIRSSVYENLNQVQHEYLILRGLAWLRTNGFGDNIEWEWNPRQSGDLAEPDLRGISKGRIVVSAEATASENPKGGLDKRMRQTLEKLSRMEGEKFYFVCTSSMESRARGKIRKGNWLIKVVQI